MALLVSTHAQALHIVIDPGHGGSDRGAVVGPAQESEIALKVALELEKLLTSEAHFQVTLTRRKDVSISLQERVQQAEKVKADLFLSIHANSSPDRRARGLELYFQNQLPSDEESLYLANIENQQVKLTDKEAQLAPATRKNDILAIVEDLKRHYRLKQSYRFSQSLLRQWIAGSEKEGQTKHSHAVRQAPFFVVSNTTMPSVLIELGFLSNPREAEKLMRSDYQRKIAQKIFYGLNEYRDKIFLASTIK